MLHQFENQKVALQLDLAVAEMATSRKPESVRVLFRRDGRELDLTPYLTERELAAAYANAARLLASPKSAPQ